MKENRSLLSLIAFCTTWVLVMSLGFVLLFTAGTVMLAFARTLGGTTEAVHADTQVTTDAQQGDVPVDSGNAIIFAGVVSDDRCKARHDMGSAKSPAECTRVCTRDGAHYIIINGQKMYYLAGREDLGMLAGEKVTVTGPLTGDTIEIKSITTED